MTARAKRGPGRPALPRGKARGAVLSVRLTDAERAAIVRKADAEGVSASDLAREILVRAVGTA